MARIATGYFGIPGRFGGKVHVVRDRKPICGTPLDPRSEFQWCSHGVTRSFVECERCKKALAKAPDWMV